MQPDPALIGLTPRDRHERHPGAAGGAHLMDEFLIVAGLLGLATFATGLILPLTTRRTAAHGAAHRDRAVATEAALADHLAARR